MFPLASTERRCLELIYYMLYNVGGTEQNLVVPLLVYPVAQIFHLFPRLWILSEKEKS
jgi:fumarate reductase subunit D